MRQEKQLFLDEIKGQIENSKTFLIMRNLGIGANLANSFRTDLAKFGGYVEIVPKRTMVKAAKEAGVDLNVDDLKGHIGLIFAGQDPLETLKGAFKFKQDNNKLIEIIGGQFEGKLHTAEQMEALSKLPNLDGMRSMMLSVLEAPLSNVLSVMNALVSSVVYCLDNKSKQES
ncbi:MAG TPA: 50S ribosomal protein L10 [Parachlamydiaceae bacterium]|nr:50S ribosomal protein L10 [Parachlamydiaceae bacterium]